MVKYLIVGNGPAGINCAQRIRNLDKSGSIIIVTDEIYPFYYKPRLPEVLCNEVSLEKIYMRKPEWYKSNNIQVKYNTSAVEIYASSKAVKTSGGESIPYNKLLLACGGSPFIPNMPGTNKSNIHTFRTASDVKIIAAQIKDKKEVTIIGGGLLALEVGYSIIKLGLKVTVVELIPRLLPRQLDEEGAVVLKRQLEDKGFLFQLGHQVEKVVDCNDIQRVVLNNKEEILSGYILVCAGIRSQTELAKNSGIEVNRGIIVDEYMRTSINDLWAAGDAAEYMGKIWGLWTVAMLQGDIAGMNMAGNEHPYIEQLNTTKLKVTGIDLISAGIIDDTNYERVTFKEDSVYRKLVISKGKAVGCILLGDITNDKNLLRCVSEGLNIENHKENILKPSFNDWGFLGV